MKFYNNYYLTQIREAISLCMEDSWGDRHESLAITMMKTIDDERGVHHFFVLEGLRAPVTVFITESTSEDCDKDAQYFLNDLKEEAMCIHAIDGTPLEMPLEDYFEGLFIILDQTTAYFVTNEAITPTSPKEEENE